MIASLVEWTACLTTNHEIVGSITALQSEIFLS